MTKSSGSDSSGGGVSASSVAVVRTDAEDSLRGRRGGAEMELPREWDELDRMR